jgi:lipopolysaccharide transport system permease protein
MESKMSYAVDNSPIEVENFQVRLTPPQKYELPNLRELWEYRELIYFLAWRDLKVRYKQTALGILWAIIPQIVNTIVYSVIFGVIAKLPSENVPYLLFTTAGLVGWGIFSRAYYGASNSLISGSSLTAKIYFPRLVVTLSSILSSLADSLVSFFVLAALMIWFRFVPDGRILALPIWIVIALLTAAAVGIWMSALTVKYRDVAQASGLLMSAWMYATPVLYTPTLLPSGPWQIFYWLNPIAIVVQGFRWSVLRSFPPPLYLAVISVALVILLLVTGLIYFQRVERTFIDLL